MFYILIYIAEVVVVNFHPINRPVNSFIVLTATGPYTYIHIITYIYILNKHTIIIVYTGINNATLVYE